MEFLIMLAVFVGISLVISTGALIFSSADYYCQEKPIQVFYKTFISCLMWLSIPVIFALLSNLY